MEALGFPIETVIVLGLMVFGALAIDLYQHRKDAPITMRNAAIWSAIWVGLAFVFYGYLYLHHNLEYANLFMSGYLLEKTLSVDNLMVFSAIFASFAIKTEYQHRILYYGILGAIVFRLIFVALGTSILSLGLWVELLFAGVVFFTAIMMLKSKGNDEEEIVDYTNHWSVRYTKKFLPVFPHIFSHNFFVRDRLSKIGWAVTPLFLALVCVEISDVMFAFDSVPAVIAISREPLIVYSAMIFAILGLRSLYFILAVAQKYLVYLDAAVIGILFWIAFKLGYNAVTHMFDLDWFTISPNISVVVVLSLLTLGIVASLFKKETQE